jgi:hypothetical protein
VLSLLGVVDVSVGVGARACAFLLGYDFRLGLHIDGEPGPLEKRIMSVLILYWWCFFPCLLFSLSYGRSHEGGREAAANFQGVQEGGRPPGEGEGGGRRGRRGDGQTHILMSCLD